MGRTRKKHKKAGREDIKNERNYHARDRWFVTAKVLLALAPFLTLGFLQSAASGEGGNIQQMLSAHPDITVSFMAAMTGPFIAYLLGFIQKRLYEGDVAYAVMNLILMAVTEAMLANLFYLAMMAALLYFVCDMSGMNPVQALRQRRRGHFLGDISGSLVLLIFGAFCLFVSLRLGMR